ncbi:MAG: glycosyltransferase [Candidatus Aminicenantes bacterium]|nr:glycosyltransferase [Candidatus Aminicenantes bacterium]
MNYTIAQFNDTFPPLMDGVAVVVWNYARWLNQNFGTCYAVVPYIPDKSEQKKRLREGPNNMALIDNARQNSQQQEQKRTRIEAEKGKGRYFNSGTAGMEGGFPVLRYFSLPLPFRYPYRIGVPWLDRRFLKELDRIEFDLVHTHCPFSAGWIARNYARRHGVPVVATFHSSIHEFAERLLKSKRLTREIIKKVAEYYESVDRVVVSSYYTRDILKQYGCCCEPEIIPHGVDLEPPKGPEEAAAMREEGNKVLRTTAEDRVLLYVGYLSREKNLCFLLRALELVKKMNIQFKMFLVGEGYARAELEATAKELGMKEEVRFVGAITERQQLKPYYARADLFLFPSVNETYSMVVREAAAFGVPVVVLEGTAVAEVIRDSENGFVTERRLEAYAEKIAFLLKNPEVAKKAGKEAFKTLYVPWDAVMARVSRLYTSLLV